MSSKIYCAIQSMDNYKAPKLTQYTSTEPMNYSSDIINSGIQSNGRCTLCQLTNYH